jgi:hypothetical protein
MKKLLLFGALILSLSANGQDILWEYNFGGSTTDRPEDIEPTPDGGIVVIGNTLSNDNDIQNNYGSWDIWLIKLDDLGNLLWSKNYGSTGADLAREIINTSDGGFIIIGSSNGADNDVSANHGNSDYWVIKLDNTGNIEWEKNYGGTLDDVGRAIIEISTGYIITGYSKSSDIDVTTNNGVEDAWTLEIDDLGNIIWEESFGGTGFDRGQRIVKTLDNNYIVSGEGGGQSLMLKFDPNGNIIWQQNNGGSGSDYATDVVVLPTGGYLTSGSSTSSDVDVPGNYGSTDGWLTRRNSQGDIAWSQNFGGSFYDKLPYSRLALDDNIIIAGYAESSDNDIPSTNGGADFWLFKMDSLGNVIWNSTFGGSFREEWPTFEILPNGDIIAAVCARSSDFDVSGNYGDYDYWVLKISDSTFSNVGIEELLQTEKALVKIVDFMGRETEFKPNTPLIFIYSDGTRERVMKLEE